MQVLAAHCVLKQSSDILASLGFMLAPALSTDRQETAEAAHPQACFRKGYSSIYHAHHCSICGAARHTQACLHTRTHVHAHTHAHAHTHTNTNTRVYTQARTHTYTCTRTNTQTHAREHTYTQTQTHSHTRVRTHTYTHAHTHIHMHAHVARVMGFANFPASLTTLIH